MYGKVRCFYRHISRKRKTREYVDQLLKVTGDLVINDVENTQKKKKKKRLLLSSRMARRKTRETTCQSASP